MKNKFMLSLISAFALSLAVQSVYAVELKIGVVKPDEILQSAPQADAARKILEKEFATRDRDLVAAQQALKELQDRLAKDGAIMSESESERINRDIANKTRELKRDMTTFQEDINFRRNEEMGKVQKLIGEALVTVAEENGYDLVLANVPYASSKADISNLVIELLKK
ncbi:MAG: OmpH family outer membrane protein [Proteobacteria bacterium]|nr:OmpH family outer membrane protein [Pseudomonadota bacterium]MBT5065933.1 OmpH family outer membrane protein [Pseudomonadota bacterium]MBT6192612.1 OmpH family outer membrane protein [Pseudomonadota bacterium]MBT6465677.1 OmpH family outer membrane protein [Pseudomonadota bacterium]MBT6675339.1 OmpH family outer membrane protein [Pseudomonadota bacterium]